MPGYYGNYSLPLHKPWTFNPAVGDRYILVPYITAAVFTPVALTPSTYQWSDVAEQGPFTVEITHADFGTFRTTINLNEPYDCQITMSTGGGGYLRRR